MKTDLLEAMKEGGAARTPEPQEPARVEHPEPAPAVKAPAVERAPAPRVERRPMPSAERPAVRTEAEPRAEREPRPEGEPKTLERAAQEHAEQRGIQAEKKTVSGGKWFEKGTLFPDYGPVPFWDKIARSIGAVATGFAGVYSYGARILAESGLTMVGAPLATSVKFLGGLLLTPAGFIGAFGGAALGYLIMKGLTQVKPSQGRK